MCAQETNGKIAVDVDTELQAGDVIYLEFNRAEESKSGGVNVYFDLSAIKGKRITEKNMGIVDAH